MLIKLTFFVCNMMTLQIWIEMLGNLVGNKIRTASHILKKGTPSSLYFAQTSKTCYDGSTCKSNQNRDVVFATISSFLLKLSTKTWVQYRVSFSVLL